MVIIWEGDCSGAVHLSLEAMGGVGGGGGGGGAGGGAVTSAWTNGGMV